MALTLTEAQKQRIEDELFALKSLSSPLPTPKNTTGANSLAAKLDPIAADPKFNDIGIGVVDFTASMSSPKIWLHNQDKAWRTGSAGKIFILLAAVQLRDDVRKVKATGLVSSAADFDELFATIWKRSKNTKIQEIADMQSSPRISTIFDLSKSPINFFGADVPLNRATLQHVHLGWSTAKDFTFWERMWLVGSQSDNVASSACVSEIGAAYMKAVQRAYKLFDPPNGMHCLLSSGYGGPAKNSPVNTSAGAPTFRAIRNQELHKVIDFHDKTNMSNQPASVAGMTAYMIALMQDKLAGVDGCTTLKTHLADTTNETTTSLIFEGVQQVDPVTKAHTKLGILGTLRCEFAYIESAGLKYGVLAMGILPKQVGSTFIDQKKRGRDLGKAIHLALKP
ncbi:MAG: serine hydrolase [Burkholderiales bacterium]|nr:serine hydrolase [Anaerolineae bacterium]